MKIRVIAFATASDALGREPVEIELTEGARLSDLRNELLSRFPTPRAPVAQAGRGRRWTADQRRCRAHRRRRGCPVAAGLGRLLMASSGLTDEPIDVAAIERSVAAEDCGAVLLFLGNVRNHHQGRAVAQLTYSAYRSMAETTLQAIARDLEAAHDRMRLAIVHRLGAVPVGEASVVIAVASPHREAAYDASRLALERLKKEVPIWKRELYSDGAEAWREEEPLAAG